MFMYSKKPYTVPSSKTSLNWCSPVVPLVIDNVILCREFEVEGEHDEACLAVLNNFYADGVVWHDVACYHEKFFVCEDSDDLLDFARQSSPPVLANRI